MNKAFFASFVLVVLSTYVCAYDAGLIFEGVSDYNLSNFEADRTRLFEQMLELPKIKHGEKLEPRKKALVAISDCQGLQDMDDDLDGAYYLSNNIDCSASISWNS